MARCTKPDRDGNPNVFELERNEDGLWLNHNWANPENRWNPKNEIVFRLRNCFFSAHIGLYVAVFLFQILKAFPPAAEHFADHIARLREELTAKTYRHGPYHAFKINDPKPRDIHKARVRDRLVHHAIYRVLYPYFDRQFIHDSYSCRVGKGTHRAIDRLRNFAMRLSRNNTRTIWVLKCDIRKFFANIDHDMLKSILRRHIRNADILWLLDQVIESFHTESRPGIGLPLGNLTS